MHRRDFLKGAAATAGLFACGGKTRTGAPAGPPPLPPGEQPDAALRDLAMIALDAARAAGATYADVRIADYRRQRIRTREARVEDITDREDRGFGVRVIAGGTWGFAASARIERDELARVARAAVALARANARMQREPLKLAPVDAYTGVWRTPIETDPFAVPLGDKVDLLLRINAEAMKVKGVAFCSSSVSVVREHKLFASTAGTVVEQTLHRCNPQFTATAVDRQKGGFQSRDSYSGPQGRGWEYVAGYPWMEDARQAGEDAVAKLTAPAVEPGPWDLVLEPSHLWLTIHESIGHPTELDRALGMEANFAGTSFMTPDKLGKLRVGSDIVTLVGEKTHEGSLATCGWDDDGVPTMEWKLIDRGMFVDYQTTRDQAHLIGRQRSHGTSYADSWKSVAFQRMPNVNLLPGDKKLSLADLIAGTDRGILIKGNGSFSIDHQRYNFQFGGQTFWRIDKGKVTGMLADVAYQARTPDFWQACDAICSEEEYQVGGSFFDGKGEPGQSNAVSHGCAPARFRRINVLNTRREV